MMTHMTPRYRRAREQAGLTLGQANRLLGFDPVRLSDIELGVEIPTESAQRRMADVYGCSVQWLRGDHVEPPVELIKALRDADVSPHDRDIVLEFACSIQHKTPRGTAAERIERVRQHTSSVAQEQSDHRAAVPVREKAAYVRSQRQTRRHHCHWPGCDKQVPPAMWGCKTHWFRLPIALRDRIWAAYVPGQEATMTPSEEYLQVADEAQRWIKEHA